MSLDGILPKIHDRWDSRSWIKCVWYFFSVESRLSVLLFCEIAIEAMEANREQCVYTFPLSTGAAPRKAGAPEFETGEAMPLSHYVFVIGAPLFTLTLTSIFGGVVISNQAMTTLCPTCCVMVYFMTLAFYVTFDVPWRIIFQSQIEKALYKHHNTDKLLRDGPGRLPMLMLFYPLAAASNLFLVILPSLNHVGVEYNYFSCAFRAMVNGVWAYGAIGVFKSITFPRYPLELAALSFLWGPLLSLGASLSAMGVAQWIDLLSSASS